MHLMGCIVQAWCDYEVVKLRELSRAQGQKQPPEGASPVARQMFDKSKLVWRHILASLNGLKSGLKLGVNVGQDEVAGLPHLTGKAVILQISLPHSISHRRVALCKLWPACRHKVVDAPAGMC